MADETKSSLFYVVGDKSIGIHQENSEKEVTLKYGKILSYISLDDQLVIAFETGYLVVVSSGIVASSNDKELQLKPSKG